MPHFVFIGRDRPDGLADRMAVRPQHLDWLSANAAAIPVAGPLLDSSGQPNGSMLVIEADSADAVAALVAGDPYAGVALFASTEILPWRWVVGKPA
jgi:hypothetical protein